MQSSFSPKFIQKRRLMKRKKEKCLKFTTREIKNVHVSFLTTRDLYWYGNGYCKNSLRITKTFRYWKKIPIHYIWTETSLHVTKSWNGHSTKDAKWCVKRDMYIFESSNEAWTETTIHNKEGNIAWRRFFADTHYVRFRAWTSCNWHIWKPILNVIMRRNIILLI